MRIKTSSKFKFGDVIYSLINFKILEIFIILYIKLYVFLYVKFYKISSLALMSATPFEYIAEVTIASAFA